MSSESDFGSSSPSHEMAQYLQMYLDETAEQLDALVETLLVLERSPTDSDQLNEAFRMVHSIKGSSALMGLETITVLTHQLENHFERLRSGTQLLDQHAMGLILRSVDFLRNGNARLRAGQSIESDPELLEELRQLQSPKVVEPKPVVTKLQKNYRIEIRLEADMPLPDLKAELVLARLGELGSIRETEPAMTELEKVAQTLRLQVLIQSQHSEDELRSVVNIAGVQSVIIDEDATDFVREELAATEVAEPVIVEEEVASIVAADPKAKVSETVRVDIDRLDHLMNLAGELVVNKARFVQIAKQMSPAFRKSNMNRARAFGEAMRRVIQSLRSDDDQEVSRAHRQLYELESELEAIEEQSTLWEESRRSFSQITDAIDQLTRVSKSLQRGVLETRMVPVSPLFNRFKRVVRDIAIELDKKVDLEISGEKTELDKRMIDELGDPLVHLVRNAIDHGIEPADVRRRNGKPEIGTLHLEAAHSGNNVFIYIRDDGGGINTSKIRKRLIERNILPASAAEALSEREAAEYVWHPGFSTAEKVSDISGRGVGMDIVKTRISELNGTIDIQSTPGRGTQFTIRLPLTLAIIRSLLFRLRHGIFAVPIDNVREIVSVPINEVVTIHGNHTFEVRGEFIPLVDIDDIFEWHEVAYDYRGYGGVASESDLKRVNVVILQTAGKTIGLRVDELLGGQDIVIKSLAENFVHIRGLSGASILGDGSVCLLLDVAASIAMASDTARQGAV